MPARPTASTSYLFKFNVMIYEIEDTIRDVRIALDLNNTSEPLLIENDIDTLTLDEIIKKKLPIGARIVHVNAPRYLLDSGKAFGGTIGWTGDIGKGSGVIHLPDDFLRLVTFQMSDWSYPITEPITDSMPIYRMQHSRYAGIRGNPQKPVVAITQQPIGQVLEFYSCKAGESVTLRRARYIPIPRIKDGGIELCEKLYDATIQYTAYLTALAIGNTAQAESLLTVSNALIDNV